MGDQHATCAGHVGVAAWFAVAPILSIGSVTTGVAINIIGHADVPYLAAVFGSLGVFAYTVWLLHAADRRRDALRVKGKLADTAPIYSLAQWRREPDVTRRAQFLAVEHDYSIHESLAVARRQLRDEQRRARPATHVETLIRSRHQDPVRAVIAATTLDIDAVAAELTAQSNVVGWAPTSQDAYDRWRELWAELAADSDIDAKEFAGRHGISVRQAQWIRSVGATGLARSHQPCSWHNWSAPTATSRTSQVPPHNQRIPASRACLPDTVKQTHSATSLLTAEHGTREGEEKCGGPRRILEHG